MLLAHGQDYLVASRLRSLSRSAFDILCCFIITLPIRRRSLILVSFFLRLRSLGVASFFCIFAIHALNSRVGRDRIIQFLCGRPIEQG